MPVHCVGKDNGAEQAICSDAPMRVSVPSPPGVSTQSVITGAAPNRLAAPSGLRSPFFAPAKAAPRVANGHALCSHAQMHTSRALHVFCI